MVEQKNRKPKEATCEIEVAFDVLGGKWKPLIIWFLAELGTLRFGQLQRLIPDITHRVLTKQLRELEANGLIRREVIAEVPVRVEYSIAERGRQAVPILDMMCKWADQNDYFGYEKKYNLCELDVTEILAEVTD